MKNKAPIPDVIMRNMRATSILLVFLLFTSRQSLFAQEIKTFRDDKIGHVHNVAFAPDGKSFLSGCTHHIVQQWDIESGRPVKVFQDKQEHAGAIHGIAFTPDNRYFAVAGHSAMLYDFNVGNKVMTYEGKHVGSVKAIAISPNGKYIAVSTPGPHFSFEIHDLETGRLLQSLNGHSGHINSLAFSPNGRFVASGSNDHTIILWELKNGLYRQLTTLHAHAEHVHALDFSFDGRFLASGNQNGTIGIWEIATESLFTVLNGHTGHIHTVDFSPDGGFIASGSYDHTIKIWDIEKGALLATYTGHTGPVHSVAFSPDGFHLLSGSQDKTIKLWDCSAINVLYVYKNEINAELQANARLFAPKDEFESSADYQRRKAEAENFKASVADKYRRNYPALKKQKIRNSYKVINLQLDNVGIYNADLQQISVSVKGITENISMPPAEARSLKENYKSAEVKAVTQLTENGINTDLFNIQLIHPVTGNVYPLGKQKKPLYMDEATAEINLNESGIPSLNATVKFKDHNGNGTLEGNEAAQLVITITNEGKGSAKNIKVNVTSDADAAIKFDKALPITIIPPGQLQVCVVNFKASDNLPSGEVNIRVSFEEDRGFQPSPLELSVNTAAQKVPKLAYVETYITEVQGNGNLMIERNENIEALVWIENKGTGAAQDVRAIIKIEDPNIVAVNPGLLTQLIGVLKPGQQKGIKFSFAVNNNYTGANQLPIRVVLSELYGKYGSTFSAGLEMKKTYHSPSGSMVAHQSDKYQQNFVDYSRYASDVDVNLPLSKTQNPDAIAVVIGNAAYSKTKPVNFAINDSRAIKNYLIQTLGFKEANILYYENATYSDLITLLGDKGNAQGKLYNTVKPGKSDVFIYYSGHGAPGLKDHKGYFVPVECDPQYVELGGYPANVFYENLAKVPAKSVTVLLDACFSGTDIFENISPIVIQSTGASGIKNGVLLASSGSTQVSTWYNEKYHGLFTYLLLKGIQTKAADLNKDNKVTLKELYQYLADKSEGVPYNARRLSGIEQDPILEGMGQDRVLVEY